MISKIFTEVLVVLAVGLGIAGVCLWFHEHGVCPVGSLKKNMRNLSIVGICALALWAMPFIQYGSTKGGNGGMTNVQMVVGPGAGTLTLVGDPPVVDEWENFTPVTSTNTTRTLTGDDFRRGFVLVCVGTNETHDFSAPSNAVVCADWRAFGAAEDWIYLAFEDWAFRLGTNEVDRLRVFSYGKIDPLVPDPTGIVATNNWFAPFVASFEIVPEANWQLISTGGTPVVPVNGQDARSPSQFWHYVTPSNTLQMTWQNAPLESDTNTPVSIQMELWPDGRFAYRYDLSRCGGTGTTGVPPVASAVIGASFGGNGWITNAIPTNVTSLAFYPLSPEDATDPDRDGDGLAAIDELFVYFTDPGRADTDEDGLDDPGEIAAGTDPWNPDTDGDGIYDADEVSLGTTPLSPDSDSDGLGDGDELCRHGTDPLLADTDGDGLPDVAEVTGTTNPTKADTDGDGLNDAAEFQQGTSPVNPDTDGDGAPDGWEIANCANPLVADTDGDGLLDGIEMKLGSSPLRADSDGDGFGDFEALTSNAWVEVASASAVTLFAAPAEGKLDDAIVTTNLPFVVEIGGFGFDRVSVDTNGKLHLIPTNGTPISSYAYGNLNPAGIAPNADDIMVAPYWDDLVLRPDLASLVRIGTDTSNGCVVVDYLGMGLYGDYDTNVSLSCQVVLSNDTNFPIRINYQSVSTNMAGGSATIGVFDRRRPSCKDRARCQSLVWSYNREDAVWPGLSLGFRFGIGTDPLNADTDGDGLNDGDEFDIGTDPMNPDTDGDGLADGAEIAACASPFVSDTDGDGMPDAWEVRYSLNPNYRNDTSADADHDGLSNLLEFQIGSSPRDSDTDGDERSDYDEYHNGTSLVLKDTDGDGLDDKDEYQRGTSGTNPDSDNDGLPDGWEVKYNLNPKYSGGIYGASGDPDSDGLTNAEELELGTNPMAKDTDGDGLDDGEEVGCRRRRYAADDEWAASSNGWTAVTIETDPDWKAAWFAFDELLKIGGEWMYDVICQWNGLMLVSSGLHYADGIVTTAPVNLSGSYVSDAALMIAPYWTESVTNSVSPTINVFKQGTGGNVRYAIQYTALAAGGTNTVSFQAVLVFTNGTYKATEVLYGRDTSVEVNGIDASIGVQDSVNGVNQSVGFNQYVSLPTYQVMQFIPGTGTDPLNEIVDSDGDGLPDDLERQIGTDPNQPDTDGDGMLDGWEHKYGFNPIVNNDDTDVDSEATNDSTCDADNDGLTNKQEADWGTDPNDDDTDNDGVTDGQEVENSSDPNDDTDGGRPASRVPVDFHFGDPSGSHSEKYRLVVKPEKNPDGQKPVSGEEPKTFEWINAEYGECETKTAMLLRGWTYEVRLYHAGTDPEYDDSPRPDYDYRLSCFPPSCVGVVTNDPQRLFGENSNSGDTFEADGKKAEILVLDGCVVGDYDRRDGFTEYDLSRAYSGKPLRHWINDDDDKGDENDSANDMPGAQGLPAVEPQPSSVPGGPPVSGPQPSGGASRVADWWNDHVDGKCDILDFTPVWMDVGKALEQLSNFLGDDGEYDLYLSCEDGSVNAIWTSLTTNNVSAFLATRVTGCGEELGQDLESATTVPLSAEETKVPDAILSAMRNDRRRGIFLIEGRKVKDRDIATSPIVLRCYRRPRASDAQPLLEFRLPLSISPVEDMYRWKNLRYPAGEEGLYMPDRTGSPTNFPDGDTDGNNVIFLHGANVSESEARAWMSEMFKRFRQTGCRARFHGVTWRSNIGATGANYQENVSNAFVTATWLADYASMQVGGRKVFVAHSLGNVVVSSAIADCGMPADAYFMCNAAVPSEALYPDAPTDSRLVHKDWADYPAALYSCNWHENFPANDSRRKLTWNGRFTNILDKAFNLYSSGDHAFELFSSGNPHFWSGLGSVNYFAERYCWQKQELGKGCLPSANPLGKTDWAGWGFENNWKGTRRKRPVPQPGETLSPQELAQYPAFRHSPSWMNSPELSQLQIDSMLAQGIPTITPAVGNQELGAVFVAQNRKRNLDSMAFKPNDWPNRGRDWKTRWLHSDMKDVAYFYNYMLYQFIVEQGGLK